VRVHGLTDQEASYSGSFDAECQLGALPAGMMILASVGGNRLPWIAQLPRAAAHCTQAMITPRAFQSLRVGRAHLQVVDDTLVDHFCAGRGHPR
jgi:hypothetical protein